jgi:hypothetical protein
MRAPPLETPMNLGACSPILRRIVYPYGVIEPSLRPPFVLHRRGDSTGSDCFMPLRQAMRRKPRKGDWAGRQIAAQARA